MKPLPMPGVYADDNGGLHLNVEELLTGAGYRDTPENRAVLLKAVYEVFGYGHVVKIEQPTDHD